MNRHTAAPWKYESSCETRDIRSPDGGLIAQLCHLKGRHGIAGRRDDAEVAANARLIAAAPELLEALQHLMGWVDGCAPNFIHDHDWPEAKHHMLAAIAKAVQS